METETKMTAIEAARAMEWAKAHGHTETEAIDLINFIANYQTQANKKDLP